MHGHSANIDEATVLGFGDEWASYTQEQLAERMQTSQSAVARMESGRVLPSGSTTPLAMVAATWVHWPAGSFAGNVRCGSRKIRRSESPGWVSNIYAEASPTGVLSMRRTPPAGNASGLIHAASVTPWSVGPLTEVLCTTVPDATVAL